MGLAPERESQWICESPKTLDAAWYRQFSGANELARGGRSLPVQDSSQSLEPDDGSARG